MKPFAVAGALVLSLASAALSQLTPEHLYTGIDRPVVCQVARPSGTEGALTIALLKAETAEPLEKVSVEEGKADLASLFTGFWGGEQAKSVRFAQLFVDSAPVGPAVVVQPLMTTLMAGSMQGRAAFPRPQQPPVLSGVRTYVDKYVEMNTSAGTMVFRLRPDQAPNSAFNFRHLAEGGLYNGVIFHRIINQPDDPRRGAFVIQGGDPTGTGMGGPGYNIDLEPSTLPHDFGVLSMARSGDPNTNGSQFFVCLSREFTAGLDTQYTAFGECIKGADVIMTIANSKTDQSDRPLQPPVINTAKLIDADPYGTGPKVVTKP